MATGRHHRAAAGLTSRLQGPLMLRDQSEQPSLVTVDPASWRTLLSVAFDMDLIGVNR
jgi:hypothetical protein